MGCGASVEAQLQQIPGVDQTHVDLKAQSVSVVFDPALTTVDALRDAVARAGYPAESERITVG